MLVICGFHPEEPLAEEIGENLVEINIPGVEVLRFKPSYMPDNIHYLPDEESVKINLDGIKELRRFIKERYDRVGFVLDLHETPTITDRRLQYEISFPGWNRRLRQILGVFAEKYEEPVLVVGEIPKAFPTYHSAVIEYYSRIKLNEKVKTMTKEQGTEFAKDLIDYLLSHYLT